MALRVRTKFVQLVNVLHRNASTGVASTSGGGNDKQKQIDPNAIVPLKPPGSCKDSELIFDEKTHTGQAWDQEDVRMVRFSGGLAKQVNPNVAMNLIARVPPTAVESRIASCDGGGGALGHPKIYINLDKPGNHACGYCGLRFYKDGQPHDGSEHIQV